MLSSHEKCPVCRKELKNSSYLNKVCKIAGGQVMSFVESICNDNLSTKPTLPPGQGDYCHIFFQVTSLYGQMFYRGVQIPFKNVEFAVNYTSGTSEIKYLNIPNIPGSNYEVLTIPHIFEMDYPNLEKMISKAKTLALFL